MGRTIRISVMLAVFLCMTLAGMAQPIPPEGGNDMQMEPGMPGGPEMQGGPGMHGGPGMQGQGGPGMRPGMPGMRPGMRGQKPDPEMEKMHAQRNSMMAMAEAHKELAGIYEQQGKIDEAAAELKKIITLAGSDFGKIATDPGIKQMVMNKILPVYHEIARLYLKNDRIADAEKVVNEGIAFFEKDNPIAATKLILQLGEIYKKSNNMAKAEETFKRVIELNQKNLK